MAFQTPVLLIAYHRPDTTKRVIDEIRAAAPERMFVGCDGPNLESAGDAEMVAATRVLIEREIDWPCNIERRYSETHQGCTIGVRSAINWIFEQSRLRRGSFSRTIALPTMTFFLTAQSFWSGTATTTVYGTSAEVIFRMVSGAVTEAITLVTSRIPGAGLRIAAAGSMMTPARSVGRRSGHPD